MNQPNRPRLGLGTVQFGLDYGISNPGGRTSLKIVSDILDTASSHGVELLDTAALYGESEKVLGELSEQTEAFRIVTKTGHLSLGEEGVDGVVREFEDSLERLGRDCVYGLLVHQASDLDPPHGSRLWDRLSEFKKPGRVTRLGVSVYDGPTSLALAERFPLDIVQVPLSIFDQRLLKSGTLETLRSRGIEIHVRSIFLQGLMFMRPDALPAYFAPIRDHLRRFHTFLEHRDIEPQEAAFDFAMNLPELDFVVFGVNDHEQLHSSLRAAETSTLGIDWSKWALNDERWVNPAKWEIATESP